MTGPSGGAGRRPDLAVRRLSPWRFVAWFGVVSLLADIVYEGARSVAGPYLATLGASAAMVGLVTGAGEAFALLGRLGTGVLADRTRAYWALTITGYAVTVAAVPLLGVSGLLWVVAALIITERAGKAIRSPARDVILSHAASAVGRGRGFAVHEALDQIGAVAGPLLVAAALVGTGGDYRPVFWLLALPGAAVLVVLVRLRRAVPDPSRYEQDERRLRYGGPDPDPDPGPDPDPDPGPGPGLGLGPEPEPGQEPGGAAEPGRLPRAFWSYLAFTVVTTTGFATFGVLSYHLATGDTVAAAAIPVIYAVAMGVDALAALATGWAYDRIGRRVLVAVPVLTAGVPPLAFSTALPVAVAGILVWAAVLGVSESTMRAAVADLVPTPRRGTAYGLFAAGYGVAALAGGLLAGGLYERHLGTLSAVVLVLQIAALGLLAASWRRPVGPPGDQAARG